MLNHPKTPFIWLNWVKLGWSGEPKELIYLFRGQDTILHFFLICSISNKTLIFLVFIFIFTPMYFLYTTTLYYSFKWCFN